MRTLLVALMIVLLPLRGWASDVMSVAMGAQALDAIVMVAVSADDTRANDQNRLQKVARAAMPADCPMLATDKSDNATPSPFKACSTCQLCMGLVTGYSMVRVGTLAPPQAAQGIVGVSFSSAERAASFKPPIS